MNRTVKLSSYAQARAHWIRNGKGDRPGAACPLGNNTELRKAGDNFVVFLGKVPVITFRPDGVTELRTGGLMTPTTKVRLNMVAGCEVFQHEGEWFVTATGLGWTREIHWLGADQPDSFVRITSKNVFELTESELP